jgi:hypothetical protein
MDQKGVFYGIIKLYNNLSVRKSGCLQKTILVSTEIIPNDTTSILMMNL